MLKKFRLSLNKNLKILGLIFLIIFTITISSISTYQKKLSKIQHNDTINNIYFKKTLNEIVNSLEPRYKKYDHKIRSGETFDKILNSYSLNEDEVIAIKKTLSNKVNINKLNTNQKIQIIVDQTNGKIKEFIFQISNTEKIYLSKDNENSKFSEEILTIKLDKNIIYEENIILLLL